MIMDYLITDYITGKTVRNVGAEASRQEFEKFLVEEKGFDKTDIRVGEKIVVQFKGEDYASTIDLVACCDAKPVMAITCVAGSIASFEREILSGARLLYDVQIPLAISTDARDAVIIDTLSGKIIGKGLDAVPAKKEAVELLKSGSDTKLDPERKEREMIIYRSFNLERVNF